LSLNVNLFRAFTIVWFFIGLDAILFIKIVNIVFPVFVIAALGYLIGRFRDIHLKALTDLVLFIAAPCLVFDALSQKGIIWFDFIAISFSATVVVLGGALITFLYFSFLGTTLPELYLPVMFMNSGNLGLPLCLLAFGEQGLRKGIIYYVTVSFLTYTLGIFIISRKGSLGEMLKVPLIYAFLLGLTVSIFHYPIPKVISRPIAMLGSVTIPLMLLSLGYKLSRIRFNNLKMASAAALLRICGGFAFGLMIIKILGLSGMTGKIVLLISMMPSAVINFILAERYQADSDLIASTIFVSTLLSLVTIPLFLIWAINP
jgi:hypothetical protein